MEKIANTQLVMSKIGRWNPSDLAFIDDLHYCSATGEYPSYIRLIARFQRRDNMKNGWPNLNDSFASVVILFVSVRNFQLKSFGNFPKQILGFDIVDISDRGMENLCFSIEDYESDHLSFSCASIVIESAD